SLISESADWKLDVIESYKELSPNNTYMHSETNAKKGDELEFIIYLAFLESTRETGLKYGIDARVELVINNSTGIAWIDWIGKGSNRRNDNAPLPGHINLRQLLAQIAKLHPRIKYFMGYRESGMRHKFNKPEFKLSAAKL
ncbi:MAG: hypothetical protein M0R50_06055, partial [Candidatus Cloacimonetes bacterium]|nr:hypothetical protein [Candidatus Cloacimonadota bacterium]